MSGSYNTACSAKKLLEDNFAGLVQDAEIKSAVFSIYEYNNYGANSYECYRLGGDWNIGSLTWNASLSIPQTIAGENAVSTAGKGKFHKFDILDTVKGWMDGSLPNYGLMVKATDETKGGGAFFTPTSTDLDPGQRPFTPDKAPQIEIVWGEQTDPGDVELGDLTINLRPLIWQSNNGLLQNLALFTDGVTAAGATVHWELVGGSSEGDVEAGEEYVYPDSTGWTFPAGTNKYQGTESNWQMEEPLADFEFNTLYKIVAQAMVLDPATGEPKLDEETGEPLVSPEVETDEFIY